VDPPIGTGTSLEADHSKLKSGPWPMRNLKRFRSAQAISEGHAFVQYLRRGRYELVTDVDFRYRLMTAFAELPLAI
jgi:IS6 family transposase